MLFVPMFDLFLFFEIVKLQKYAHFDTSFKTKTRLIFIRNG